MYSDRSCRRDFPLFLNTQQFFPLHCNSFSGSRRCNCEPFLASFETRIVGFVHLSSAGFTTFGVRYYNSTVGRWTQQDLKAGSLFDARSSNRYVYAKCDPVNVVDPGGKQASGGILGDAFLGVQEIHPRLSLASSYLLRLLQR